MAFQSEDITPFHIVSALSIVSSTPMSLMSFMDIEMSDEERCAVTCSRFGFGGFRAVFVPDEISNAQTDCASQDGGSAGGMAPVST